MSEFDVWRGRIDAVLLKLDAECSEFSEKSDAWKERMRDQVCFLGMTIAKLFDGEVLKADIKSSMAELSKVREEMKETIATVMELQNELGRLTTEEDVIKQGSPDECRWIAEGIDRLYSDKNLPTVSRQIEWLKGFGRAVESYMMFWAKEKDQMVELYEQFERSEAEWDAVGEVGSDSDWNPMHR